MMKQLRRAMLVGILALGVVAGGGDGETDADPKAEGGDVEGEVLVFAAASLTDAFGDIKTAFTVEADSFSASAKQKIESAGGKVIVNE